MKHLWLLALLCSGCISTRTQLEQGIVSRGLTIGKFGNESLEASVTSARVEGIYQVVGPFYGAIGIGPTFIQPIDGKSQAFALDLVNTLSYVDFGWQPFVIFGAGLFHSVDRWGEQETLWGFTLHGGVGVSREVAEGQTFHVSYRQWHESNGSQVFGHNKENPAFEGGSLWVGYTVDF